MIASHGSIAAAGRAVKMSYKRAWMLVEEMNAPYRDPRVESTRGGSHGGGARVTGTGAQVLAHYRKLEEQAANMGAPEIDAIRALPKTAGRPALPPAGSVAVPFLRDLARKTAKLAKKRRKYRFCVNS